MKLRSIHVFDLTGAAGQNNLDGPHSKADAQRNFGSKFKAKTGGHWEDRDSLVRDPKKYFYLKGVYDFEEPKAQEVEAPKKRGKKAAAAGPPKPPPECKLNPRLQELVKLVCNVDEMAKQMAEVQPSSASSASSLVPFPASPLEFF